MLQKLYPLPCLVLALACATGMAWPDEKPPAETPAGIGDLTSTKPGPQPKLEPIKLEYTASWKGMLDAGYLQFVFGAKAPPPADAGKTYLVQASGTSTGLAKALFTYNIDFQSRLHPDSLAP